MPTLTMCIGLPGSGKSTWAAEQAKENLGRVVVVNKDTIRKHLEETTDWVWSKEAEEQVILHRDGQIAYALSQDCDVISDDTNFSLVHQKRLKQLAIQHGANFAIKNFYTPIEECIRRDVERGLRGGVSVGGRVITDMAKRYGVKDLDMAHQFAKVTPDEHLMNAIICDLDGTLALNNGHRSFYDASTADKDDLNYPIRKVIETFYRFMHYQIIYLSGREEKDRESTETFLRKHTCPPGPLHMRSTGDSRKDWIVKGELFDKHIRGKYNVVFCLDDRDQVVKFWRSIGLTVFQVADGNF